MATTDRTAVVVGAGLAGALLASFLVRRGWRVEVLERRPDPRARGFIGGRSINLALSARGIDALERVGLAERVLDDAIPMRGRMMHDAEGRLAFQAYSKDSTDAIHSVSRGGLNLTLLEAAEAHDACTLLFGRRCLGVDLEQAEVTVLNEATGAEETYTGDLVVGADGAFSAVRDQMRISDRFDFSQEYLEHGYKELTIPPTPDGDFAMEPNALHIWPRGGFMMIALPNGDRSFTCTCFWPFTGPAGFDRLETDEQIRRHFERVFRDAVPLMPTLVDDFQRNPISSLVTVRCRPWHRGRVVIVGDAAHAIVPFYGQGMNAAFEDCVALDACLERHDDVEAALTAFSAERKENGDAIADLALENFIEMRDKVASPMFRLEKRIGHALHGLFPKWFVPLYHLVTFTTVPYAEARRRSRTRMRRWRGAGVIVAIALMVLVVALVLHFARPAGTGRLTPMTLTYTTYLHLADLLRLQEPRSDPEEHDELLFIVIHQTYELWFKLLLHEFDKVKDDLDEGDLYGAVATFHRCRTIMKTLVSQLDILETMTPMSFTSFRERLDTSSGFQSTQFREFEFVLGYKRPEVLKWLPADPEGAARVQRRLEERSVVDCFYRFLEQHGARIPDERLERDVTAPSEADPRVQDELLRLYRSRPDLVILFELMTDFDEGQQEWRYRHVKVVERTIGSKRGTGGSPGVAFLKQSLFEPVFDDLWAIRHRL